MATKEPPIGPCLRCHVQIIDGPNAMPWFVPVATGRLGPFCTKECADRAAKWSIQQQLEAVFGDVGHGMVALGTILPNAEETALFHEMMAARERADVPDNDD